MNEANICKLLALKDLVESEVPLTANAFNIWEYLGWSNAESHAYATGKKYGVDLRPVLSPLLSDLIAIITDGALGFPWPPGFYSWEEVLEGDVLQFKGAHPKTRMLAVLYTTLLNVATPATTTRH